ncbi:dimethyl sulfoxide reductase anchor subunit family protein [Sinisalibacter aestuarii]|uniref:DMSO reductase n=1 Tax=Sinisalibacter aestuarii TaxID=2949426 RepID=A0ABQ5LN54_9RHOB|nr:DmsC/YnfH family molybdoenzyme membrane anchor subunit [Sinisalibacter aestuarii]GKY86386.1 DMSO reductase [Sinisalibacter aestuarii]
MHPAPSVIVFTSISGLGFGLFMWLGLGFPSFTGMAAFGVYFMAYALSVGGLLSSVLHLANKKNAIYAFSQWQTSWLSREGILSVIALFTFAPMAIAQIFFASDSLNWLGPIGSALALITVFSTSMIYAQLKTIPRWHMPLTPVLYLTYAIAGGALLSMQAKVAGVLLIVVLALQWAYWTMGDKRLAETGSDKGTATGLGSIGKVRMFESAHTARNYILDEMFFTVGRKHSQKLRMISTVLIGVVPVLMLLLLPVSMPMAIAALLIHVAGVLTSRWLFFAEAEHVVSLYYSRG